MSLRARMGLAAGVAVALAVIAVAFSAYAGTRSQLQGQVDQSLQSLTGSVLADAGPSADGTRHRPGRDRHRTVAAADRARRAAAVDRPAPTPAARTPTATPMTATRVSGSTTARPAFGGAAGSVTLVHHDGVALRAAAARRADPGRRARAGRSRPAGSGQYYTDMTVSGTPHPRARDRDPVARGAAGRAAAERRRQRALEPAAAAGADLRPAGSLLAALLGLLVARTALAPIARFTRQTEAIAANPERIEHERLDVHGGDELARLAQTFNRTLDALERSVAGAAQPGRRRLARAAHADRDDPRQPAADARRAAAVARGPRGAARRRDRGARRADGAGRRRRRARPRHQAERRARRRARSTRSSPRPSSGPAAGRRS